MSYKLSLGAWDQIFAVPADVVDKHLLLASGKQIKVLLFFLRHSGTPLDTESVAKQLRMKEAEVEEALDFWANAELLQKSDNHLLPAAEKEVAMDVKPASIEPKAVSRKEITPAPTQEDDRNKKELPPFPSQSETNQRMTEEPLLQVFCKKTEEILGRTLTPTDLKFLLWCKEYLTLPEKVLYLLFSHYKKLGKTDTAMLKQAATAWWEKELFTEKAALAHLAALEAAKETETRMRRLLEWGTRSFTPKQKSYIQNWTMEWQFTDDVIALAFQTAKDNEVKTVFPYMHGILSRWAEEGLYHVSDILAAEEKFENENKPTPQKKQPVKKEQKEKIVKETSYDLKEVENLLNTLPNL